MGSHFICLSYIGCAVEHMSLSIFYAVPSWDGFVPFWKGNLPAATSCSRRHSPFISIKKLFVHRWGMRDKLKVTEVVYVYKGNGSFQKIFLCFGLYDQITLVLFSRKYRTTLRAVLTWRFHSSAVPTVPMGHHWWPLWLWTPPRSSSSPRWFCAVSRKRNVTSLIVHVLSILHGCSPFSVKYVSC